MNPNTIFFDLDGTLIDSSSGILSVLKKVLDKERLIPRCKLDTSLIGPPLRMTLSKLSGLDDDQLLNKMIQHFKEEYDTVGYKLSEPYSGINEMLLKLKRGDIEMYIATNKRLLPAAQIISYLGWDSIFKNIYSIDSKTPPYEDKAQMLREHMVNNMLDIENLFYVGDKKEDGFAAASCGIKFIKANWGFGDFIGQNLPEVYYQADSPEEIAELILSYDL